MARPTMHMMAALLAAMGIHASVAVAAQGEERPHSCEVEVRLTSITSIRTTDAGETDVDAAGEYYVGTLTSAPLGPFGLRTGDASSFSPGLSFEVIDTGWPYPAEGDSIVAAVTFFLSVREDDSNPVGEDDHDDVSEQLTIREHIVCPGGVTRLTRTINVAQIEAGGRNRRSDRIRLGLELRAVR